MLIIYCFCSVENPDLNSIPGCAAVYTIRTHQALTKVMHLIDENCIVGPNDVIPGLSDGVRDPKTGCKFLSNLMDFVCVCMHVCVHACASTIPRYCADIRNGQLLTLIQNGIT